MRAEEEAARFERQYIKEGRRHAQTLENLERAHETLANLRWTLRVRKDRIEELEGVLKLLLQKHQAVSQCPADSWFPHEKVRRVLEDEDY
jgi:hypothetical protein